MIVKTLVLGSYRANCYIVYDEESSEGIIIDPGAQASNVLEEIEKLDISLKYIVLTHGHLDHIGAVEAVRAHTGALVLVHHDDKEMVEDATINMSGTVAFSPDRTIGEGEVISFGHQKIKVLHTPGHSKGGICLYFEKEQVLFSGDTLFRASIGRSDLYGGSQKQLVQMIQEKLMCLPDDVVVYPGHNERTTIGYERAHNMFLQG